MPFVLLWDNQFSKKPVKQPLTDFTEKFIIQEKKQLQKGECAYDIYGSTLRYYDKEGLLPFVERSSGGIRMFREKDYEWLQIIECLKKAGMSIKDIKKYIVLLQQGDSTIQERLELFQHQRTVLLEQMASLQQTLNTLDYKCWYYETALKAGTTDVLQNMPIEDIPEQFQEVRQNLTHVPMPTSA